MLFFEGSFVAGKETLSCHFGIGRSCCHLGRRACPIQSPTCQYFVSIHRFSISQRFIAGPLLLEWLRSWETNLARVDLGAGESVVVCTHLDCILGVPEVVESTVYRNELRNHSHDTATGHELQVCAVD